MSVHCGIQRRETWRVPCQSSFTEVVQRMLRKGRLEMRIGQHGKAMEEPSGPQRGEAKREKIFSPLRLTELENVLTVFFGEVVIGRILDNVRWKVTLLKQNSEKPTPKLFR